MEPTATFNAEGKIDVYKIDTTSNLYTMVVKQLIKYSMSQDINDLPLSIPLAMMLPKNARSKVVKAFLNKDVEVRYDISDCWTYVWHSKHFKENGWFFNGELVSNREN